MFILEKGAAMITLITGANRGLGIELVKDGLQRGHEVIATYRSPGEELLKLKEIYGDKLYLEAMDVSDYDSVKAAFSRISAVYDAIDVVVNNAAVLLETKYYKGDPIVEMDLDKFYETFQVNIFGPVRVLREFMPLVYKGKDRCVVNITSEGAKLKKEGSHYIAYSSSKIALNMYTQKIRNYLKAHDDKKDIRIYMIHPGRMDTIMGVENAEISPAIPSKGIWDIIENKIEINLDIPFINYKGEQMPC